MTSYTPEQTALAYARKGWPVFPCKPNEKVPLTLHGFKDAATDAATIGQWWAGWPEANVAIATGEKSGVFVLDIDVKNGAQGIQSLAELEAQYGKLPETLTVTTPSGGLHHYFKYPQDRVANRTAFRPGLDIRGDGGYVLAPPSVVGEAGYAWQSEGTEPVEAPSWLLDVISTDSPAASKGNAKQALLGTQAGSRNDTAFRYAASLISRATPYEEAKILVLQAAANCHPSLSESEAMKCLDSAYGRYVQGSRRLTELGNAERMIDRFGEYLRYVPALNTWLDWSGSRWQSCDLGEIHQFAKAVVRAILQEAVASVDEDIQAGLFKHAKNSEKAAALNNLIALAAVQPGVALRADQLDADDNLFGVANGVVNLKTGRLQLPRPEDHITKYGHVAYDAAATCPQWDKFVMEIMGGDASLAGFLQHLVGYTLMGGNSEQIMLVLHGNGANGKSTFLRVMQILFGSYARAADSSLFMVRKFQGGGGGPREDIVRLKDARFVLTTEVGEGELLDEDLVKRMTGDDTLAARVPYGKSTIEFQAKFTPWMATNYKPIIRGDGHAIWRRLMLVPFEQTFKGDKKDKGLLHKLQKEMSGILNWAIQGCLAWQKEGLDVPAAVKNATEEYRDEMDLLGEWIHGNCVLGTAHEAQTTDLYSSYRLWCLGNETKPLSRQTFGRKLKPRGFKDGWVKGERGWKGIALKQAQVRAVA